MEIYISKRVILDKELSDYGYAAYLAIRSLYYGKRNRYYITTKMLYHELTEELHPVRVTEESIHKAIKELHDKNYIQILKEDKDVFYIDVSNLYIDDKEEYCVIYDEEIKKILNYEYKYKFKLLRYFSYLISTFYYEETDGKVLRYGTRDIDFMSDDIGLDRKTIMKYNSLLKELHIIIIYTSNDLIVFDNGELGGINNLYGRLRDKKEIENKGRLHDAKYGQAHRKRINKETSNLNRSAMQKYNSLLKGKIYDEKDLITIYNTLDIYNQKQTDKTKVKDLSIFSKYPFYEKVVRL